MTGDIGVRKVSVGDKARTVRGAARFREVWMLINGIAAIIVGIVLVAYTDPDLDAFGT